MERTPTRLLLVAAAVLLAAGCRGGCGCQPGPDLSAARTAIAGQPAVEAKMFALRVGHSPSAPRDYFITDPTLPERIPVDFWFWAVQTGDRLILIDCGFTSPARAEQWGIADWRSPDTLLTEAGLPASMVTDVIVTHGHWDHVGGLGLFPGVRVWIDPRALAAATRDARKSDPALAKLLNGLVGRERLRQLDHARAVVPGVVVFPTGLHAPGAWAVAVKAADGVWVFASDEVPLYRNLTKRIPSGQTSDPNRSLALYAKLLDLVGGHVGRIIPGHDSQLPMRFERVDDRVIRIGAKP